jgi:AAA15 family ATPase/GTPase
MDTLKNIILRGNIKNADEIQPTNTAAHFLEFIPCCSQKDVMPLQFSIKFIEETSKGNILFSYSLSIDIGGFMERNHERKILNETLLVNDQLIFSRGESIEFGMLEEMKHFYITITKKNIDIAKDIAVNGLNDVELFLTNGFKNIFGAKLVSLITGWLENKLIVICQANDFQMTKKIVNPKNKTAPIEKTLNEAAKIFGINSNALTYIEQKDGAEEILCSVFNNEGVGMAIPAKYFESYGTIRFVNEFPLIVSAIMNGATLVIDEFDASIHPMALMSIINMFHNDNINKSGAQLIFNTHNPIFLNNNLFRRDEIKFVERDDETHRSTHYSLSDFGTAGKNGVRKGEDYMKNYFVSRYGAIKDIDFSPIFDDNDKDES